MQGEQQAILRMFPTLSTDTDLPTRGVNVAVGLGAVSAFQAVPGAGEGCWVTIKVRTGDITIAAGVANMGSPTAADQVVHAGGGEDYWLQKPLTGFRIFGIAAADVHWHRSG
jgi:hypothetical protein